MEYYKDKYETSLFMLIVFLTPAIISTAIILIVLILM